MFTESIFTWITVRMMTSEIFPRLVQSFQMRTPHEQSIRLDTSSKLNRLQIEPLCTMYKSRWHWSIFNECNFLFHANQLQTQLEFITIQRKNIIEWNTLNADTCSEPSIVRSWNFWELYVFRFCWKTNESWPLISFSCVARKTENASRI